MTSIFVVRDGRVLLLFRRGSRAIADSWVGIGGHVDPAEIGDPTATVLRELHEEVGLVSDDLQDLALRYVAIRDDGSELRLTHYFTATMRPGVPAPTECAEGDLQWFELAEAQPELAMPPTMRVAFDHWRTEGRWDGALRAIVMTTGGPMVVELDSRPV